MQKKSVVAISLMVLVVVVAGMFIYVSENAINFSPSSIPITINCGLAGANTVRTCYAVVNGNTMSCDNRLFSKNGVLKPQIAKSCKISVNAVVGDVVSVYATPDCGRGFNYSIASGTGSKIDSHFSCVPARTETVTCLFDTVNPGITQSCTSKYGGCTTKSGQKKCSIKIFGSVAQESVEFTSSCDDGVNPAQVVSLDNKAATVAFSCAVPVINTVKCVFDDKSFIHSCWVVGNSTTQRCEGKGSCSIVGVNGLSGETRTVMSDCDINIHNFNMIGPSGSSRAQRVQAVNFKCNPPVTENITCEFIPDGTAGSGSNACYTVGSAPAGWYGQWPLQCVTSPGQTSCSMSVSGFRNSVLNFQTSCNSANPPYTSVYTLGSASATGSRVLPQWTVPLFCGDRICTENQSIFDNVKGTWFVCKNGAWADCGVMGICS